MKELLDLQVGMYLFWRREVHSGMSALNECTDRMSALNECTDFAMSALKTKATKHHKSHLVTRTRNRKQEGQGNYNQHQQYFPIQR